MEERSSTSPTQPADLSQPADRPGGAPRPAPRPARGPLRALLTIGLIGLAVTEAGACRSLDKAELERRLHALPKNAALSTLERRTLRLETGEEALELELVVHHAAARTTPENGPRLPVLLVHGTPSTLFSWTEIIHGAEAGSGSEDSSGFRGLCEARDVFAIEVIGHGVAPGDVAPYSFARCGAFVAAAIEALELDRVHLVGSSYGGEFAWRAALERPERVASLTLIDSSGIARRAGDWLPEEVVMRENRLAGIGWVLNSRSRIASALAPHFAEVPPDRVEEFFLVCENAGNWKAMVDLARDENGEREEDLRTLRAPTLLLWGSRDLAYPADHYAQRMASLIPDARLVLLEDTGHYPHEERPAEVLRVLEPFLAAEEVQR